MRGPLELRRFVGKHPLPQAAHEAPNSPLRGRGDARYTRINGERLVAVSVRTRWNAPTEDVSFEPDKG